MSVPEREDRRQEPPLLDVRGLAVRFPSRARTTEASEVEAVRDVSLTVGRGEIVGLLGESGSGKSLTALAVLGLVPPPGRIAAGSIRFEGRELVGLAEPEWRSVRGARIGLALQEPSSALNPVLSIGTQLVEAIRAHRRLDRRAAEGRALDLLGRLGLGSAGEAADRMRRLPFELSGGQRQRALLAIALAADPRLLIADEPTSALDPIVATEVLDRLAGLRREQGLAILLITHDLAAAARICDRLVVLHAGRVIETAATRDLLEGAAHPLARELVATSLPVPFA
jgi:ABC-type glutathione transport system ATPase component